MVNSNRFPRPTLVFLDGDQPVTPGCLLLPGGDAPERVVFEGLKSKNWTLLDSKTVREFSALADACSRAMSAADHHEWASSAANKVHLSSDTLWQAMCSQWAGNCLTTEDATKLVNPIRHALA
jgi:hypothetical protein